MVDLYRPIYVLNVKDLKNTLSNVRRVTIRLILTKDPKFTRNTQGFFSIRHLPKEFQFGILASVIPAPRCLATNRHFA